MDAQSRSSIFLASALDSASSSENIDFEAAAALEPELDDDGFPADLSAETECRLAQLCDSLFIELDSDTPDLRAMERYQAVCDELALRHLASGVA